MGDRYFVKTGREEFIGFLLSKAGPVSTFIDEHGREYTVPTVELVEVCRI